MMDKKRNDKNKKQKKLGFPSPLKLEIIPHWKWIFQFL
jgi:hypothetical protein